MRSTAASKPHDYANGGAAYAYIYPCADRYTSPNGNTDGNANA